MLPRSSSSFPLRVNMYINMNGIRNRNNHNNVVIIYTDNSVMMRGRNIEGS